LIQEPDSETFLLSLQFSSLWLMNVNMLDNLLAEFSSSAAAKSKWAMRTFDLTNLIVSLKILRLKLYNVSGLEDTFYICIGPLEEWRHLFFVTLHLTVS
jgi:hypothetical protein